MRTARRIGAALLAALTLTAGLVTWQASPAGADSQIGWVLAASGSAQCVVKSGTNNHVVCTKYPAGGGAGTVVIDGWAPYACLGGAYMVAGNNAGTPAQLIIRNVTGYYCGWHSSSSASSLIRAGTCWNGSHWQEGYLTFNGGVAQRLGNVYSAATPSGNFPGQGCAYVGNSAIGFYIY